MNYGDEQHPHAQVCGIDLDAQTRCAHYHSVRDIIAIRMKCCGVFYACKECHEALADHAIRVWPRDEFDRQVILCGSCRTKLSIRQYLEGADMCPVCEAPFNPGCRNHYHFYFEMPN